MTNLNAQDLIIDEAELTCPITIKRGKTSRMYQVIAYPTQLTRKTTNVCLDGTATPDAKAIKKCRWHTAGIIRFHVNPETNLIYEARPDLHELEITLECLLEESHKEQLAKRAEDICRCEIISKLDHLRNHDIVLRYDYSLGGTSTARASLTISAEEVNKIDLDKQIFGKSKAEHMIVSRALMDKITASVTTKLRVVEDIGVGGSSFGQDLIKEEISKAISASGFQKFSLDDIKQMQNADTDITDDLKADIINSASTSNANSLASDHHTLEQSSSADSSDMLHEKSDSTRRAGGQSSGSSQSSSWNANISVGGYGLGGGKSSSNSSSQSTNFDNADSSPKKDHEIVSTDSSHLSENSGSNSSSNSNSSAVQGQIRRTKDIDATIVHRSDIAKGFTISLERWHHQLATTSIKGRLTTKTDIELPEEMQAKEEAERAKQARKEEEERNAKTKAMRQECELTPQQIDDILHAIDSMDEDKLRDMHAEFLELCSDGEMTREVFANAFRNVFSSGKVNNYYRYAFSIFDKDNNGTLNFTEYIMAMHIHESDNIEDSLALAFNVFDYDKSGQIDQKEILHMITATSELLGNACETQSAKILAKKILDTCDKRRNGKITKEEFVNGCKNNREYCLVLLPNFEQTATTLDPNYEGDLDYGRKHGRGVYTWPDGRRYEGQWNNDKQTDKGLYIWPDGRQYEGEMKDNLKNGYGIETLSNGESYAGEWKNDKKDGKGTSTTEDGNRYEGQWKNNKKNEKGIQKFANGDLYDGEWQDNSKQGQGTMIYKSGVKYTGQWNSDEYHGKGVYTWADGSQYEGNFKNDNFDGYGVRIYIKMVISTRDNGRMIRDMDKAFCFCLTATGLRVSGKMEKGIPMAVFTARAACNGMDTSALT